jgi:uncharacterized surface protein with fasciclin (FAS1) repeats
MRKIIATAIATASAIALSAGALAPAATAADGTKSLAAVLTSDGGRQFDRNHKDFDILTEAVLAVLAAKPDSPVKVLTDGSTALTAFVPNDKAFMHLVHSLTGTMPRSERKTFAAVAGLGIDTVETVLLYHVVPGATIDSKTALGADGAHLTTAQGGAFRVNVVKSHGTKRIRLQDQDRNARNPRVIGVDVNKGNMQIAHVIDRVLRPLDLPPTVR